MEIDTEERIFIVDVGSQVCPTEFAKSDRMSDLNTHFIFDKVAGDSAMKIKLLLASILMAGFSMQTIADNCSATIDSTDGMRYDKNEIVVDKSCKEFTINLTHSGKLAKNVMGHNVVITKTADAPAVAGDAIAAGLDNQYVKPGDDRVIMFTDIIGGGEKTSKSFSVDKLKAGEAYTFFCSFPGHISLMTGTVSLK